MGGGIAEIGGMIGDPVRAAMLAGLMDGRALPAGELALLGNVAPQTASFHLAKLLDVGLLSVERQGRHKYYRLSNESIASALEAVAGLSRVPAATRYESNLKKELRFARRCYKHLAGQLAVEIHRAMLERRMLLELPGKSYSLTAAGQCAIGLPPTTPSGRACLDWTERFPHIGGPLGVTLFAHMQEKRWIASTPQSRAVRLTHPGRRELHNRLGVSVNS